MTDAARLDAIFERIGDLEKTSAMAHVSIQAAVERMGNKVELLAERQAIANGRTTKLEYRVGELEVIAKLAARDDAQQDEKRDFVREKSWALLTGSFLVLLGAVLGYFI